MPQSLLLVQGLPPPPFPPLVLQSVGQFETVSPRLVSQTPFPQDGIGEALGVTLGVTLGVEDGLIVTLGVGVGVASGLTSKLTISEE